MLSLINQSPEIQYHVVKTVMIRANIYISKFGSHSVRSAAVSKAKLNSVPIMDILQKAGWSNEKTFAKFYNKKINNQEDRFQSGVFQ